MGRKRLLFGGCSVLPLQAQGAWHVARQAHNLSGGLGQALDTPTALATGHSILKVATNQPGPPGPSLHL